MESKQLEERIAELEAQLIAMREEYENRLDAVESYYVKAIHNECIPMEGGNVVSLNTIDKWCNAYADGSISEANDYLSTVGIDCRSSEPSTVSFEDASILARKLWVYVCSYMNGGHDYLFDHALLYLQNTPEAHLRSELWISQRQRAIEQLKELEDRFIALANINISLPANAADLYLAVVNEMLRDADDKTTYDVDHSDGSIQEINLLIDLIKREVDRAESLITGFDRRLIADAISGNSLIDVKHIDFSVLNELCTVTQDY